MTNAFSFCDCMERMNGIILPNSEIDGIYCGSYFCDRYFTSISWNLWDYAAELCARHGTSMILVIPMPGPMLLEQIKEMVLRIINTYPVAELVVNDYGMYHWLNGLSFQLPIWIGRLLSKDPRDPRYDIHADMIKFHDRILQTDLFSMQHPYGVEADIVAPRQRLGDLKFCRLALHTPIIYLSTGRICEFASIGEEMPAKFRPGRECQRQCVTNWLEYNRDGITYYKFGRGVYARVQSLSEWEDQPIRMIHNELIGRAGL